MVAFDVAEVCVLVGNFLLHKLSEKYGRKNITLYRDDGLEIFKNVSGPASSKFNKHFCNLFREHELRPSLECNRKVMNFLNVTLNLEN